MGSRMRWILVASLLAAAFAGCLSSPEAEPGPALPSPSQQGPSPGGGPGSGAFNDSQSPPETESAAPPRIWPEPSLASIRPGAALDDGSCTANFVFTSLDNQSIYIGTAAHCFSNDINTQTNGCLANIDPLGAKMSISGADRAGVLVYSSWATMQANNETSSLCNENDFALLQIHEDDEAKVSPALWRFGGPTGLATSRDVAAFDRVLSYGNSGTRPQDSLLSPREGYVTVPAGGCDTRVVFPNPAIPGDSGSPVILADGRALGDFVSIELTPLPGQGHVCLLDGLLRYAAANGFEVQLATWELLDDGILPL